MGACGAAIILLTSNLMGIGELHAHIKTTPLGGVSSLDFGLSSVPSWGLFFDWRREPVKRALPESASHTL